MVLRRARGDGTWCRPCRCSPTRARSASRRPRNHAASRRIRLRRPSTSMPARCASVKCRRPPFAGRVLPVYRDRPNLGARDRLLLLRSGTASRTARVPRAGRPRRGRACSSAPRSRTWLPRATAPVVDKTGSGLSAFLPLGRLPLLHGHRRLPEARRLQDYHLDGERISSTSPFTITLRRAARAAADDADEGLPVRHWMACPRRRSGRACSWPICSTAPA